MMNSTEWRCSNVIKELKLNSKVQWNWKDLLKKNRRLTGIRYKSLEKSKKILFRIKCISNSLPVLDVLKKRASDLYKSDECKECYTGQETSIHLF